MSQKLEHYDEDGQLKTSGGGGSGTVTSVALTATPTSVFDVSGSPVTSSGTLALSMDDQVANTVLAGPASGADAEPAFRVMVPADFPIQVVPQGRLTLTTATPVTMSDVTAAETVYYTPYVGSFLPLYDGSTSWSLYQFSELSVAVPATTVTPFDIFVYDNAGSLALETVNWTNDTTRATAIVRQNGMYVKSGTTTKLYLGTGRTTGTSGQTEDSAGALNTVAKRYIWNMYNRVHRTMFAGDSTSHTYTTAAFRYWNNDARNRSEFMIGVYEDPMWLYVSQRATFAAGDVPATVSFGINQNTGHNSPGSSLWSVVGTVRGVASGEWESVAFVTGFNYVAALEYGGSPSPTFVTVYLSSAVMA